MLERVEYWIGYRNTEVRCVSSDTGELAPIDCAGRLESWTGSWPLEAAGTAVQDSLYPLQIIVEGLSALEFQRRTHRPR